MMYFLPLRRAVFEFCKLPRSIRHQHLLWCRQPITIGSNQDNKIVLQAPTSCRWHFIFVAVANSDCKWFQKVNALLQGLGMPEHLCEIENFQEGVVVLWLRAWQNGWKRSKATKWLMVKAWFFLAWGQNMSAAWKWTWRKEYEGNPSCLSHLRVFPNLGSGLAPGEGLCEWLCYEREWAEEAEGWRPSLTLTSSSPSHVVTGKLCRDCRLITLNSWEIFWEAFSGHNAGYCTLSLLCFFSLSAIHEEDEGMRQMKKHLSVDVSLFCQRPTKDCDCSTDS